MTLTRYDDLVQRSDEWYALRRGIPTASSIGNLLTVGRLGAIDYDCPSCSANVGDPCISQARKEPAAIKTFHAERSAVAAAADDDQALIVTVAHNDTARTFTELLVAERITGWTDPTYTSADMWQGIYDEPVARDLYSATYSPVTECGFMVLERDGWRFGWSPDGLVDEGNGSIEVKSRRSKKQLATVLADRVPAENMAQLQGGLFVSGRAWVDYVSMCGGMALWTTRVYPDPRWFAAIEAALIEFEQTAADMEARYYAAVEGLPMTERNIVLDDVQEMR